MKLAFPNGALLETGSVFSFRALIVIAFKGSVFLFYTYPFAK
jgi:hypothetical protein